MHIYGAFETCIVVAARLKYAAAWRGTAMERGKQKQMAVLCESQRGLTSPNLTS